MLGSTHSMPIYKMPKTSVVPGSKVKLTKSTSCLALSLSAASLTSSQAQACQTHKEQQQEQRGQLTVFRPQMLTPKTTSRPRLVSRISLDFWRRLRVSGLALEFNMARRVPAVCQSYVVACNLFLDSIDTGACQPSRGDDRPGRFLVKCLTRLVISPMHISSRKVLLQ